MESFLPSEIARLVLGYLEEQKCDAAYDTFLATSINLEECLKMRKDGRKFRTQVLGLSLFDILYEYSAIYSLVQERLKKIDQETADSLKHSGSLLDKVTFLLNATGSGQTMLVSIRLPPGKSPQNSTIAHIRKPVKSGSYDRKREYLRKTSRPQFAGVPENPDQAQIQPSNLETTALSSLPGNSSLNRNIAIDIEHIDDDANKTPKRKFHQTSRRSRTGSVSPERTEENLNLSVYQQALLDHELHEKIAENINKVIHTPDIAGNGSSAVQEPGSQSLALYDPNTSSCMSNNFTLELDNAIKTIVHQTESDPVFENFLHEVVGQDTSDDTDDRGISDTSTPCKSTPETTKKQPAIKHRLRNAKKRSTSPTEVPPSNQIECENLAAIQSIIAMNAEKPSKETTVPEAIHQPEQNPVAQPTVVQPTQFVLEPRSTPVDQQIMIDTMSSSSSVTNDMPVNSNTNLVMIGQQQPSAYVIADQFQQVYQQPTTSDNRFIVFSNKLGGVGQQIVMQPQFQLAQPTVISEADILAMPLIMCTDDRQPSTYIVPQNIYSTITPHAPKRKRELPLLKPKCPKKIPISKEELNACSISTQETDTVRFTISVQAEPKPTGNVTDTNTQSDQQQTQVVQQQTQVVQQQTQVVQQQSQVVQQQTQVVQQQTQVAQQQTQVAQQQTQVAQQQTQVVQQQTQVAQQQTQPDLQQDKQPTLQEPTQQEPSQEEPIQEPEKPICSLSVPIISLSSTKKDEATTDPKSFTPPASQNKVLSLSTPRNSRSHVRALDFTTPPKENLSARKALTSPKAGTSKSPKSSAKKVRASLFTSPLKIPKVPIATRSPMAKLSGGWNKIHGAETITGVSSSPGKRSKEDIVSSSTDQTKGKRLRARRTAAPKSKAKPKSRKSNDKPITKRTKPEIVIKIGKSEPPIRKTRAKNIDSWDEDLRALITPVTITKKAKPVRKTAKSKSQNNSHEDEKAIEEALSHIEETATKKALDKIDKATNKPEETSQIEVIAKEEPAKTVIKKEESVSKNIKSEIMKHVEIEKNQETGKELIIPIESVRPVKPRYNKKCNVGMIPKKVITNQDECIPKIVTTVNINEKSDKVILSPSKMNANKRSLVEVEQKLDPIEVVVMPEISRMIPEVQETDPLAEVEKVTPDLARPSCSNVLSTVKRNLTPGLETPIKHDGLLYPVTPRLYTPFSCTDSPFSRIFAENAGSVDLNLIPTPNLPITPQIVFTPNSQNSGSGYASRPTDYSNSSSYYQPSDSGSTKKLESILIEECKNLNTDNTIKNDVSSNSSKVDYILNETTLPISNNERNVITSITTQETITSNTNTGQVATVHLQNVSRSSIEQISESDSSLCSSSDSESSDDASGKESNNTVIRKPKTKSPIKNKQPLSPEILDIAPKIKKTRTPKIVKSKGINIIEYENIEHYDPPQIKSYVKNKHGELLKELAEKRKRVMLELRETPEIKPRKKKVTARTRAPSRRTRSQISSQDNTSIEDKSEKIVDNIEDKTIKEPIAKTRKTSQKPKTIESIAARLKGQSNLNKDDLKPQQNESKVVLKQISAIETEPKVELLNKMITEHEASQDNQSKSTETAIVKAQNKKQLKRGRNSKMIDDSVALKTENKKVKQSELATVDSKVNENKPDNIDSKANENKFEKTDSKIKESSFVNVDTKVKSTNVDSKMIESKPEKVASKLKEIKSAKVNSKMIESKPEKVESKVKENKSVKVDSKIIESKLDKNDSKGKESKSAKVSSKVVESEPEKIDSKVKESKSSKVESKVAESKTEKVKDSKVAKVDLKVVESKSVKVDSKIKENKSAKADSKIESKPEKVDSKLKEKVESKVKEKKSEKVDSKIISEPPKVKEQTKKDNIKEVKSKLVIESVESKQKQQNKKDCSKVKDAEIKKDPKLKRQNKPDSSAVKSNIALEPRLIISDCVTTKNKQNQKDSTHDKKNEAINIGPLCKGSEMLTDQNKDGITSILVDSIITEVPSTNTSIENRSPPYMQLGEEEIPRLHISSDDDEFSTSEISSQIKDPDNLVKCLKERGIYLVPNKPYISILETVLTQKNTESEQVLNLSKDEDEIKKNSNNDPKELNIEIFKTDQTTKVKIKSHVVLDASKKINLDEIKLQQSVLTDTILGKKVKKLESTPTQSVIENQSDDLDNIALSGDSEYNFDVKVTNEDSAEFIKLNFETTETKSQKKLSDYNLEVLEKTISAKVFVNEMEQERFLTVTPFIELLSIPTAKKRRLTKLSNSSDSSGDNIELKVQKLETAKIKDSTVTEEIVKNQPKCSGKVNITLEQYKNKCNKKNIHSVLEVLRTKTEEIVCRTEKQENLTDLSSVSNEKEPNMDNQEVNLKKRKVSFDSDSEQPNAKRALLRNLDLDIFLTKVHGPEDKS